MSKDSTAQDASPRGQAARRAEDAAARRLRQGARAALETALAAHVASFDRRQALARFHRLSPETIETETETAARAVLQEIERALRRERARAGHWSYDLNRHIALLAAWRAETARLDRISRSAAGGR